MLHLQTHPDSFPPINGGPVVEIEKKPAISSFSELVDVITPRIEEQKEKPLKLEKNSSYKEFELAPFPS